MASEHPALQRLGAAVLLQDLALRDTYYLVSLAISYRKRQGIRPDVRVLALQTELGAAVHADRLRHDDVAEAPIEQSQSIGTDEAAALLGMSRRQVQRIARSLDGQRSRPGTTWVFDRRVVVAYRDSVQAA